MVYSSLRKLQPLDLRLDEATDDLEAIFLIIYCETDAAKCGRNGEGGMCYLEL